MKKRLKTYLGAIQAQLNGEPLPNEKIISKKELLVQIQFFQHERFIHLIVTIAFAFFALIIFLCTFLYQEILLYVLFFLFLVLLIPYIRHYYILETGVQKLYDYYDRL